MLTPEREQVSVLALFRDGLIEPVRFKKQGRVYDILSINLRYTAKQGREEFLYFAVSDSTSTHKLVYASAGHRWYLEEETWL